MALHKTEHLFCLVGPGTLQRRWESRGGVLPFRNRWECDVVIEGWSMYIMRALELWFRS